MKTMDSKFINLVIELTKKEIRLRYKRSFLGFGWSLANPLLMMAVFTLIFSRFPKLTGMEMPYHLFFLTGYLPWIFFSSTCQAGKDAIVANGGIVRQVAFNRLALPISTLFASFIHFILALALLITYILIHPGVHISKLIYLLPFLIFLQAAFLFGVVQLLATLNVFFRDIGQVLEIGLTFLFYLTPVFYSFSLFSGNDQWIVYILKLNPMCHFVVLYRALLIDGAAHPIESWFILILWTILSWRFGSRMFKSKEGIFAKEL